MKKLSLVLGLCLLILGGQIYAETQEECVKNVTRWCGQPRCKVDVDSYCPQKWQSAGQKAVAGCKNKGHRICPKPRCDQSPADYCKTHLRS